MMLRSFPLKFEPDYDEGVTYHQKLKAAHPELASDQHTHLDREINFFGEISRIPPISVANSNKPLVNLFNTVLAQEYHRESVFTYPTELFDTLYEYSFARDTFTPKEYVKTFYEWFRHNDLALLQKDVILCPINYAYTWHLVVIEKPLNSTLTDQVSNVYFVSTHQVTPQYSLAKVFTKYLEMAFCAMGYTVFPDNFNYQELILKEYAHQSQVLLCVYTELAYKISVAKKNMSVYFSGIKPQVQRLKFDHYVFARYIQTLLNCFAVEHNEYGQIPSFDVIAIEDEDLSWVEKTDIDRILNPDRQMRVVRPIRQFATKRPPVSEWATYKRDGGNMRRVSGIGPSTDESSQKTSSSNTSKRL